MGASRCLENLGDYKEAVEVLVRGNLYQKAIDVLRRFNRLSPVNRQQAIAPRRTLQELCLASAELHFKVGNTEKMKNSLKDIHSVEARVEFLKKRNLVDDAAKELLEEGRGVEAAKIMRDNGSFLDAAKYARNSGDSCLAADCIFAYVLTSLDISKKEQMEQMEEARKLYEDADRMNSVGEVLLQQARLFGDRRKVEEAVTNFRNVQNTCGELECVELLWDLAGDEHGVPGEDTWNAVKMVESVLQLIESLSGTNGDVMTQKQIERCEEHFGLYTEGDPSKRVVRRKERDRFLSFSQGILKRPAPGSKWEVDLYDVRQRIAEVLFHRVAKLIKLVREVLDNTFLIHDTCQKFLVDLPCEAENCQYQHKCPSQESNDERFRAILDEIWLDAQANDFHKTTKKFRNQSTCIFQGELESLDNLFPSDTFASCRKLLAFFFPANGQSSSICLQSCISRLRDEKHEFHKKRLFKFAEELWNKNATKEEILSSADSFLPVSHLLQLIGVPSSIQPWIRKIVETFSKNYDSHEINKLVIPKSVGIAVERGTQLTLFSQWWEDSKIYLHFDRDILKAGHNTVRRFLTMTANPGKKLPFPSPRNCLDILEYVTCAHLALFARLQQSLKSRYFVCLPASYSSVISFWDSLNCTTTQHSGIYQAASMYPSHPSIIRKVKKFLHDLVSLMLGGYSVDFNVLKGVLNNCCIKSGETERAVILVLTLLCNCGQSIPPDCEARLLQSMHTELSSDVTLPERIARCLKQVKEAKGIRDIVVTLQDLLQKRDEILCDVHWENAQQQLWWEKVNLNNYPSIFYTDVLERLAQETKDLQAEEGLKSGVVEDTLMADSEFGGQLEEAELSGDVDHTRHERLEAIEREEALQTESWEEKIAAEEARAVDSPAEQEVIEDPFDIYFRPFRVDQSGCGICNVSFGPNQGENSQRVLEDEKRQFESTDTGASGSVEQWSQLSPHRFWSRARHLAKDSPHWKKVEHFEAYKKLFREELLPYQGMLNNLLIEAADLQRTAEHQGKSLTLLSTKVDEVNRAAYFITEVKARIQQECNWADLESFKKAIVSLGVALKTCEEEIRLICSRESG